MTMFISDIICPLCGAYYNSNLHCSNGHPNNLEQVDSFSIPVEAHNPFPQSLREGQRLETTEPQKLLEPRDSDVQIYMLPYEPTDTEGHSNESRGIIVDSQVGYTQRFAVEQHVMSGEIITPINEAVDYALAAQ